MKGKLWDYIPVHQLYISVGVGQCSEIFEVQPGKTVPSQLFWWHLAFSIRSNTATTHPRVLLCDEPTAACDLQTDRQIHETLLHGFLVAKFGRTIFLRLWGCFVVERWEFPMQVTHFGNKHREEDICNLRFRQGRRDQHLLKPVGVVAKWLWWLGLGSRWEKVCQSQIVTCFQDLRSIEGYHSPDLKDNWRWGVSLLGQKNYCT